MSWFLIFERSAPSRSPGAAITSGGRAGSGTRAEPHYRAFKCLMIVQAADAKAALYAAAQSTGHIGDYFAVIVNGVTEDVLPREFPG